ncbi:MAG: winged helix-turn-helix transcriptional regulator, partial [Eubacteriales bacterium]|nr:winged helix-turn-helix transcriptional regulator [Eubacteriales bacterium]
VPQEGIDDRIISLIRENKDITTEEIASILNVSSKTIKRHIEKMPNVKYVGSGYSGHWEITDNQ